MNTNLKQLKNQNASVTTRTCRERTLAAKNILLDWGSVAPQEVSGTLSLITNAVGTPLELLFFPLLTVTAAMMRGHTKVQLNNEWSEACILWTVVAGAKGQKKTAVFRILAKALKEVEEDLPPIMDENGEQVEQARIHMTNNQFTFPKLHDQMYSNDGECVLLYDELSMFYDQLEHQNGSQTDKQMLLSLCNGDSWSPSTKTDKMVVIEKTHFNYTGFVQPAIAVTMLNKVDYDGFNDRHVAIVCPPRSKIYFDELGSTNDSISLGSVLKTIRHHHQYPTIYTLSQEARAVFRDFYNEMEDRTEEVQDEEDLAGLFSKSQGHLARISMVIHVLYSSVLHHLQNTEEEVSIPLEIPVVTVDMGISLLRYCIAQKMALMPPCSTIN